MRQRRGLRLVITAFSWVLLLNFGQVPSALAAGWCRSAQQDPTRILREAFRGKQELESRSQLRMSENLVNEQGQPGFWSFSHDYFSTISRSAGGPRGRITVDVFGAEWMTLVKDSVAPWSKSIKAAKTRFLEMMQAPLDFVIDNYKARRPHWAAEFVEHLKEYAQKYIGRSTYIVVKGQLGVGFGERPKEPDILGVLRLIDEMNGIVPMEEYLNIRFDSKGRKKVEPGNFAIRHDLNAQTFNEILIQLLAHLKYRYSSENVDDLVFVTYADRQSQIMYKKIGFTPIPLSELEIADSVTYRSLGAPEKGILITADQVEWMPMKSSFSQLMTLFENLETARQTKNVDSHEIQSLHQRFNSLAKKDDTPEDWEKHGERLRSQVSFDIRTKGRPKTERALQECTIHSFYEKFWEPQWIASVTFSDGVQPMSISSVVALDFANLPLKEGFSKGGVTYHNGVLTSIRKNTSQGGASGGANWDSEILILEISPDLKTISSVKLIRKLNSKIQEVYEAWF